MNVLYIGRVKMEGNGKNLEAELLGITLQGRFVRGEDGFGAGRGSRVAEVLED